MIAVGDLWIYSTAPLNEHGCFVIVSLLIQLTPRAQNISGPWGELYRRYKSKLRSTKHTSHIRTIEVPRTPRFQLLQEWK